MYQTNYKWALHIVENELWINWPHRVVQLAPTMGRVEPINLFLRNVITRLNRTQMIFLDSIR